MEPIKEPLKRIVDLIIVGPKDIELILLMSLTYLGDIVY